MPSGPAITLGLGPKIGPKGKRKRKGGRRCCTHVCVVAVQGRAGVVTGLCHSSRRVIRRHEGGSRREFWSFRVSDSSAFIRIISRERLFVCISSSSEMPYASIHPVHVASTTTLVLVAAKYLLILPTPHATGALAATFMTILRHLARHAPPRRHRRHVCRVPFTLPREESRSRTVSTLPPLHDAGGAATARRTRVDMAAMVQAQPTATGAKSIADLQKLLATMKLASSRSRRVDRQLDDVTEAVNSFKATTSTQGEKLAALEKSYFTLLERVVGSEGDKAESGRGKAKSKPGGKGGGGIGGKGGNDSSGGPGASPDGKNASASPDGKSRDAKSDARSKAGGRSSSKGGSRADTGAGAGGAGTESRIEAESPRGGEEGDSRKGKGRGKGGGNGGGRRGEDDLPRDLPDGSAAPSRAEAKSSMPHESDDDTPGKDGGGRGSGKGGRSNSRRGKGKEGGAADPDPNAAPLSPIRPNAITSSS